MSCVWLAGFQASPLAETPRSPERLRDLGRSLGELDKALRGFIHPGAVREFDWDLRYADSARTRLHFIADNNKKALLERFISRFETLFLPRLPSLPTQVIQNDANDWNVLVDNQHREQISGIIDFGDAIHTVLVAEVAIACAYAALGTDESIGASAKLLSGFHEKYPLMEEEINLIYDLIAMRLVTSVTFAASRHDKALDNPYLTISEAPAWQLLEKMGAMSPRLVTAILRKACGFDAVNGAGAIRRWIAENNQTFVPIVFPAPATMNKALVPYGDASHFMTIASSEQRAEEATQWWDDFCSRNKIELGIGAWGEKRTVYADSAFVSRFIERDRRDRHLGIDLFMAAGSPLFTPLNAIVVSVDVERKPLSYGGVIVLQHQPIDCPPFLTVWGHIAHEALERLHTGPKTKGWRSRRLYR